MIELRQSSSIKEDLLNGDFLPVNSQSSNIISYQRGQHVQVFINLSSQVTELKLPEGKVLLNNYSDLKSEKLLPYQAILIEVKNHG